MANCLQLPPTRAVRLPFRSSAPSCVYACSFAVCLSALPGVAVRSALPWPFRWAVLAVVFGFCAATGLWAFQLGREIAELDGGAKIELQQARAKLVILRAELSAAVTARDKAQTIADTAGTLVNTEKEATTSLMAQNCQLDAENRKLKDDLGFFEELIPSTGGERIVVRGLQAELLNGSQIK